MLKKGFKNFAAAMLTVVLAGTAIGGCGSPNTGDDLSGNANQASIIAGSKSANKDSVYDISKPIEFDVFWNYGWFNIESRWGESIISREIEKRMNCKINYQAPGGNESEKLNIMIASDSLPDVIVIDRNESYKKLIDLGKLVPLDHYFKKYPGYRENIDQEAVNFSKVNGKIYGILNWATTKRHPTGNGGWAVNGEIYTDMGSPQINTLDDLFKYCLNVKEKRYKASGKDVIPLELDPENFQNGLFQLYFSFGGIGSVCEDMVYQPEGMRELKFFMNDPRWEMTMVFANKMWTNNLMSKDYFVEKAQQRDDKLSTGSVAVYASPNVVNEAHKAENRWKMLDPWGSYIIIEPPSGGGFDQKKIANTTFKTLGWNSICISNKAKDPERIYQVLDWIASNEGQLITFYGPKGGLWDKLDENGYPILKRSRSDLNADEAKALACEVYSLPGMSEWIDFSKLAANNRLIKSKRDMVISAQAKITWNHSVDVTAWEGLFTKANTKEGLIFKRVQDYVRKQIPRIVMAKDENEVKRLIKETINQVYKMDFEKVEKYKTDIWLENLKKLGR